MVGIAVLPVLAFVILTRLFKLSGDFFIWVKIKDNMYPPCKAVKIRKKLDIVLLVLTIARDAH